MWQKAHGPQPIQLPANIYCSLWLFTSQGRLLATASNPPPPPFRCPQRKTDPVRTRKYQKHHGKLYSVMKLNSKEGKLINQSINRNHGKLTSSRSVWGRMGGTQSSDRRSLRPRRPWEGGDKLHPPAGKQSPKGGSEKRRGGGGATDYRHAPVGVAQKRCRRMLEGLSLETEPEPDVQRRGGCLLKPRWKQNSGL